MPIDEMPAEILERNKRKKPPKGLTIIKQQENEPYIIYNGTEGNLRKRLHNIFLIRLLKQLENLDLK